MRTVKFNMTPTQWQLWSLMTLVLVLAMAVDSDVRERRVPNVLVLLALGLGMLLNTIGPTNTSQGITAHGMLASDPGALGASGALWGTVAGFAAFMPLYLLRATGAGDVKLMAAVGSFAGPAEAISLALCIVMAGGVLAVLRMLWIGKSRLVLTQVKTVLHGWSLGLPHAFDARTQTADHMPYALAFAGGVMGYSLWRLRGGAALLAW
jgi:prepilin peptidase CpaA